MLDRGDGSDVSFVVDEETFPAHRPCSPMFRAQLHGSMADATMPSITLHDINAATFKAMLRFIYTDDLPAGDHELGAMESLLDLLVVADWYALDRLKFVCQQDMGWRVRNFHKAALTDGFLELVQKFPSVLAELRQKFGA
ncbi:hypothetical protein EJB05_48126, partial [Eragrostis curvula]